MKVMVNLEYVQMKDFFQLFALTVGTEKTTKKTSCS